MLNWFAEILTNFCFDIAVGREARLAYAGAVIGLRVKGNYYGGEDEAAVYAVMAIELWVNDNNYSGGELAYERVKTLQRHRYAIAHLLRCISAPVWVVIGLRVKGNNYGGEDEAAVYAVMAIELWVNENNYSGGELAYERV